MVQRHRVAMCRAQMIAIRKSLTINSGARLQGFGTAVLTSISQLPMQVLCAATGSTDRYRWIFHRAGQPSSIMMIRVEEGGEKNGALYTTAL